MLEPFELFLGGLKSNLEGERWLCTDEETSDKQNNTSDSTASFLKFSKLVSSEKDARS
jgi:hypothetical protein